MLTFELKLSVQSCQLLFNLIRYNAVRDTPLPKKYRDETERWAEIVDHAQYKMFIVHARTLTNEGLIVKDTKDANRQWRVTLKGTLVAKLLEMEFDEAKRAAQVLKIVNRKQITSRKTND